MNTRRLSRITLMLSIAAFFACLPFVSFCKPLERTCDGIPAWAILIWGWMTAGMGKWHILWFANPGLALTWVLILIAAGTRSLGSKIIAVISAALTVLLAATFLLGAEVMDNTSGIPTKVEPHMGYWLWLASMVLALVSAASITSSPEKTSVS